MVSAVVKNDDGVVGTVLGAAVGIPATDVQLAIADGG